MSLFQNSVLNKYLKGINSGKAERAWNTFKTHFHNPEIQENIRNSKEEQYQGEFLIDLFVNVFGYVKNPNPNFNLTTELKNIKGAKKTDGAILQEDKAIAVIELKGTNTVDLAKVENQAFGYKNNQPGCTYVITSNFEKLRFYIDNAVEYEEFNLFKLTKERFDILFLCCSEENLLNGIPKQIKDESLTREETVTKKLYKDYSLFRNEIFDDIQKLNPEYDKLTLFKKTQKLLDRFLFIFFAEDRLLVPPNSIDKIVTKWKDDVAFGDVKPLYSIFQQYFNVLNIGRPAMGKREEIFAYNGGLFAPDDLLDSITINDDLLYRHTVNLSNYDFESEVSVNILGHIFEHSLTEIETIQAQLEGQEIDKSKTKRKKDGVFYTPKYITKYIVDNTVGKLCEERKNELGIDENEFDKERKGRKKATLKKLSQQLDDYRSWLLQITICDPACGSGAFLNQALEFLIEEHRYIDELKAKLLGDALVFSEVQNDILENNIFGVDINEESIEIAKLSLWLRTAKKGRKLTSLNSNIKCGNSLIDDEEVAGKQAFNWQKEFPDIINNGGFDVIIGNPPYVRVQTIKSNIENESKVLEEKYHSATRRYDLFVLFMEKAFNLIKESGKVNYILPHKFLVADFGFGIRQFLKENNFVSELIHFGHELVFTDASTYTCIVGLEKNSHTLKYKRISTSELLLNKPYDIVELKDLEDTKWELNDKQTENLLTKLKTNELNLGSILDSLFQGIKNTSDKIFMLSGHIEGNTFKGYSKELDHEIIIEAGIVLPVAKGKDIKRYSSLNIDFYVIYPHKIEDSKTVPFEEEELKLNFPKAYDYLVQFKDFLIEKKIRFKTNPKYWYSLHRARELAEFEKLKIVSATIQNYPHFTLDQTKALTDAGGYNIILKPTISLSLKELLPILNSSLMWFFISNTSSVYSGGYYAFNTTFLKPFPIPEVEKIKSCNFEKLCSDNLEKTESVIQITKKFARAILRNFNIEKLSKNLISWHLLNFKQFMGELKKKKVKLSLAEQSEWEEYFDQEKLKASNLLQEIKMNDDYINKQVYDLYNLTDSEITLVEEATA